MDQNPAERADNASSMTDSRLKIDLDLIVSPIRVIELNNLVKSGGREAIRKVNSECSY